MANAKIMTTTKLHQSVKPYSSCHPNPNSCIRNTPSPITALPNVPMQIMHATTMTHGPTHIYLRFQLPTNDHIMLLTLMISVLSLLVLSLYSYSLVLVTPHSWTTFVMILSDFLFQRISSCLYMYM